MRRRREIDRVRRSVAAVWRWQQIGLEGRLCGHDPRHEAHARRRAKSLQVPFLFFALANFFTQEIDVGEIAHGLCPQIKYVIVLS
jgi:hypothetical protein